ncbi:MAG TPA: type VII secretion integral membrane protein EccD [Pseudonocardiaceae bacterium]|nr:type VII secretion integral membrane protein EccD [Pseudonocardiaceae bacterium]
MATGTTVFSRVTVVAPRTRIDVALPADVAIADLLPMLLEMAREATPDGGARHGGWCLARLGEAPLDPSRTLASLGVVDGDMIQLRRRSDTPPPPLYDDVVDAIAGATPESYRPWTKETARRIAHTAGGLGFVAAAAAALLIGPLGTGGNAIIAAIVAGITAVVAIAIGATVARGYNSAGTGVLITAAGGLTMAFVAGLYIVPHFPGRPNFMLGFALVLIVAAVSILIIGSGITWFVAAGTVGLLGFLAYLVATLVPSATDGAIGAGTAAVALAALSVLPRITIQLAGLPLPTVPSGAEELKDESGFPDFDLIEKRAGRAHEYMTGMIIGCGAAAALASVLAASSGMWGMLEGAAVALVLLLRGRTYANGSQAVALLATGMLAAAGLLIGWMVESSGLMMKLVVFGVLVVVTAGALIVGVVFPERKFSPVLRRSVDVVEALLIAAVLPLAFAVMNLYAAVRHVHFG